MQKGVKAREGEERIARGEARALANFSAQEEHETGAKREGKTTCTGTRPKGMKKGGGGGGRCQLRGLQLFSNLVVRGGKLNCTPKGRGVCILPHFSILVSL